MIKSTVNYKIAARCKIQIAFSGECICDILYYYAFYFVVLVEAYLVVCVWGILLLVSAQLLPGGA